MATRLDGAPVDPSYPLVNHGGPVMKTQKVYLIFWSPSGYSFPAGYESSIKQFAQDVAASPGATSNAYGAIQQYGVNNVFAYGGSFDDTDSFPVTGSTDCPTNSGTVCLTEYDLFYEIATIQQAMNWSGGYVNQFALILPPGVDTCFDDLASDGCSYNAFCAYHSAYGYYGSSTPYVFLALPYEVTWPQGCHTTDGASVQPEPNGGADVLISPMSHEEREAATDPLGNAWHDNSPNTPGGNEADDKCYLTWGSQIGNNGTDDYNQLINGDAYETQNEWSNKLMGCYQVGPPTVTSLSATSANPGASVGITGSNFFMPIGGTPTVQFNGVSSGSVTVDSLTHLTATVPVGVHPGKVTVQALGGTGTSSQTFGQVPAITSLTDTLGHPDTDDVTGTTLVVNGTGFFGVTSVKFNNVVAAFSSVATDGMSLHVVVPATATTGEITVTTSTGGTSNQEDFTVKPKITGFTPLKAPGGSTLTITGTGLAGTTTVDFQGHTGGVPVSGTPTTSQVKVVVPMDATTDPITTNNGTDSATSVPSFTPQPAISSFTPADGAVGTTVTITGGELQDVTVKFGTFSASLTGTPTATSLQANVPAGFSSGMITVTSIEGTAVSKTTFAVTKVTSISPASAVGGATITLTGQGLASTNEVDFTGAAPPATVVGSPTATAVKVIVPVDATTGGITLHTPNAVVTTASFKPLPKITGLSVVDGMAGDPVHVTGTNLVGATVKFGTVPASSPTNPTATGFDTTVPGLPFSSGTVSVTTPGGTGTSTQIFQITKVTSISPTLAAAGAPVTITGQGLGDVQTVDFTGSSGATITGRGPTSLKVVVPGDALDGPLHVNMPDTETPATPIFKPLPRITGVDHPTYKAGDVVSVTGTNLLVSGATSLKIGSVTTSIIGPSMSPTGFAFTIPPNAVTGAISYTDGAGTTTSAANLVHVVPTITEPLSTTTGVAGAKITLGGQTFTGTKSVTFGNDTHSALFTVGTGGTSLTVTIPTTAQSGHISVTNAGGTTTTTDSFTVLPVVKSFTPTSVAVGANLTVSGTGFVGATQVDFGGGVSAAPTGTPTATSLTVVVPAGATSGALRVETSSAGPSALSAPSLTITFSVTGISPAIAVSGSTIDIHGIGLGGALSVTFNGIPVTTFGTVSGDGTSLPVTVPSGAVSGTVVVTKGTVTTHSPQAFTLLEVTSMEESAGLPGSTVVIHGHGFTAVDSVDFQGGVPAAGFTVDSDTQISAQVPQGAVGTTGPIDLGDSSTTPASVVSTADFTVESLDGVSINEVRTDGSGFVELYNSNGSGSVDLSGTYLMFRPATARDGTTDSTIVQFPNGTTLDAQSWLEVDTSALNTTGGGIALLYPDLVFAAEMGYGTATNAFVVGAPAPAPPSGDSIARSPDGHSSNDDGDDFHLTTTPTRGSANVITLAVLSVTKSGTGTGTVTSDNGTGISCGGTCSTTPLEPGTVVTLTATPDAGSSFVQWSGGPCDQTTATTCQVTLDSDTSFAAVFSSP